MKKISLRTIIISLVSLLVLGIIAFFPLPYVLEMPGSAEKVEDFITIEGIITTSNPFISTSNIASSC